MSTSASASPAERLAATVAAFDALADRLVEFDSRPAVALADPQVRRGRSAEVATSLSHGLSTVWSAFPQLSAWRAEAVAAGSAAGDRTGAARRALGVPVALGGATVRAEDAVAVAGAILDGVEDSAEALWSAWTEVVARADALATRARALTARVPAGQGVGPGVDPESRTRVGEEVAAWGEAARADPLLPPDDAPVRAALADLEGAVDVALDLESRRHGLAGRLSVLADELDAAAEALAAVPDLVAANLADAPDAPDAPDGPDGPDGPDAPDALVERSATMAARLRALATRPAPVTAAAVDRVVRLADAADELKLELHAAFEERAAPLRERADLRGLLAACRAKAAACGLDTARQLGVAHDRAADALDRRPTDLATCRVWVAAYGALVDAAVEPPGPPAGGLPAQAGAADGFTVEVFAVPPRPVDGLASPPGAVEVHALVTVIPPPLPDPVPVAVVVIVDCSGSMDDPPATLAVVRDAAAAAVDALDDGTLFAVVAGRSEATLVYPSGGDATLAVADERTRTEAGDAVAALQARGSTEMSRWLRLTRLLFEAAPAGLHHAVLVADGRNAGGDEVIVSRELEAGRGRYRCDCLGLGPAAAVSDLPRIADALEGSFAQVAPDRLVAAVESRIAEIRPGAREMMLRVRHPEGTTIRFPRPLRPGPASVAEGSIAVDGFTEDRALGRIADGARDVHLCVVVESGVAARNADADADVGELALVGVVVDGQAGPSEPVRAPNSSRGEAGAF